MAEFDSNLPPELAIEAQRIARRQKVADMMVQGGLQPLKGQNTGRFYVPPSPLEGIAKVMQAYMGAKMGADTDADTAALGGRYRQGISDEMARYQQTRDGSPGRAPMLDPQESEQMADQGSPMQPNVGAVQGDPRAAVQQAILSQYPQVRELGKLDFTAQQADKTRQADRDFRASESAENRAARMQERAMVLEAAAQNASLSREERAARAAEAADLRREIQSSQQAFQAAQARQAAADRAALVATTAQTGKTPPGYRASANGNLEAIPGGPADTKLQGAFNADTNALQGGVADLDRLAVEANKVLTHPGLPGITGIAGKFPNIPGTDAANAEALLGTLKSQVGFGVLQAMRNASKTGGALGSVSDAEGKRLEANLASLDKAQSLEQFKDSLGQIIKFTEDAKGRMRNAYNMRHQGAGQGSPGSWSVVR